MENFNSQEESMEISVQSPWQLNHGLFLDYKSLKFKLSKECIDSQERKRSSYSSLNQWNIFGKGLKDLLNLTSCLSDLKDPELKLKFP